MDFGQVSLQEKYEFVQFLKESGIEEKLIRARNMLVEMAEQGHWDSQEDLAIMCRDGEGGPVDLHQAWRWAIEARRNGGTYDELLIGLIEGDGGIPELQPAAKELGNWNEAKKAYRAALARPAETASPATPSA